MTPRHGPHGMGDLFAAQFVWVGSQWLHVLARCHPFRFEMISERWKFLVTFIWIMVPFRFELMYRTQGNPRTVNREHQHGARRNNNG
jgi:hypothetical protein